MRNGETGSGNRKRTLEAERNEGAVLAEAFTEAHGVGDADR